MCTLSPCVCHSVAMAMTNCAGVAMATANLHHLLFTLDFFCNHFLLYCTHTPFCNHFPLYCTLFGKHFPPYYTHFCKHIGLPLANISTNMDIASPMCVLVYLNFGRNSILMSQIMQCSLPPLPSRGAICGSWPFPS